VPAGGGVQGDGGAGLAQRLVRKKP
jgi:hypothetical protein